MGLPMAQKLVKSGIACARLCGTHIFETTGWIYTIWSSVELSRPVVVQHHGHLTLTLDFQGQILKMLYLRNGRADWHGTKRMWVDRMLHPLCHFQRSPHPWHWPWIFKVKFWKKKSYLRNGVADWHGIKGMWVVRMLDPCCDFQCPPNPWPWPWIFQVKFWKCCISRMGGPIDMERKGCESIGCYTHFVTSKFDLNHDLDLGFSRSNFEKVLAYDWDGRLTWNERDVSR